jgi:hypothetical protein
MQLACLWSVDPSSLDGQLKEPTTGILGELAPAESETRSGN